MKKKGAVWWQSQRVVLCAQHKSWLAGPEDESGAATVWWQTDKPETGGAFIKHVPEPISTWPPLEPQHQMKNGTCLKKEWWVKLGWHLSFCAEVYKIAPYPWNLLLRLTTSENCYVIFGVPIIVTSNQCDGGSLYIFLGDKVYIFGSRKIN